MSAATTTMPLSSPPHSHSHSNSHSHPHSHSHSHSHSRPTLSRPSTTPRGHPASSMGQAKSPLLSSHILKSQSTLPKGSTSPSYFGLLVGDDADPPDSNPGHHTRQNWDHPSSQARSVAPAPRALPADTNHEFDEFRRQSESNRFNLSHGSLSSFARPSQSRQSTSSNFDSPISPRAPIQRRSSRDATGPVEAKVDKAEAPSYFDVPRQDSPAPLSPRLGAVADHQHARLSLPGDKLQTPPVDKGRQVQRADTLPHDLGKDNPTMITPQQFAALMDALLDEILLLDLRVYQHYATSRLKGALNLCIPTTLLKRPSFSVQKLADTFTSDEDQATFARWKDCRYIVLYDANSSQLKDAATSINVIKKFSTEGWEGQGIIVRGGFLAASRAVPGLVDKGPIGQTGGAAKQVLTIEASGQSAAPVAGGCLMPTTKTAANPFFGNIRQNMDLLDGVGQMPIKRPTGMTEESERRLPRWLRQVSETKNEGKAVSDRFLAIEKAEQKRMQQALSSSVSYGSPNPEATKRVQIAGIEKGSKNRYNNIFPYDHSRVRLQGVSTEGCDYVNANYVKAAYSSKRYIATQAPIPTTFDDFWRVVWEQDARVIVMLTAESEGGQVKSHPYWHAGTYGSLKLKSLSEKRVSLTAKALSTSSSVQKRPSMGQRRSTAHTLGEKKHDPTSPSSDTPSVVVRHLTLSHSSQPFEPIREITQLHYSHWPDFGAPTDPRHLLALIEQTNKYERGSSPSSSSNSIPQSTTSRPSIIHCSAGCGRTGTFCTIDTVCEMLRRQKAFRSQASNDDMDVDFDDDWIRRDDVDLVAKTVEDFRLQRLSMVQNLRQFVLCYEAVLQWIVDDQSNEYKFGRQGSR